VDATGQLIQEARNSLKSLANAPGGDPTVKQIQQKALARKLMDAAREYQTVQQAAKQQYRTQLERQFRIAKPNASSQEVRQAMNSDVNVFQQQILSSRVGDQRRMLQEVENRQHDLEKIEQSLIELFELMQEMQMILEVCLYVYLSLSNNNRL
jgi:syntaxin 1B/2/3